MSTASARAPSASTQRPLSIQVLTALLGAEAILTLAAGIALSMAAGAADESGDSAADPLRFAAGAGVILAFLGYRAARNTWLGRTRAYGQAAILQLALLAGLGVALLVIGWQPALVAAMALPAGVFVLLTTRGVREALGQV
jgi:hypothetical protein